MVITNLLTGIKLVARETFVIPHHSIETITIKTINNRSKIVVNTLSGYHGIPETISFYFDEVTTPSLPDATALRAKLLVYNEGYNVPQTLIATDNQTVFTFTKPFSDTTNIHVEIDDIETMDFTITGDGEITLGSACLGGERVSILSFE
jgi:hypothetical protein